MKKILVGAILCTIVILGSSWNDDTQKIASASAPLSETDLDSIADARAVFVKEIMESIKGKEKMSADSVFKNIKIFKTMPAERLVMMMDKGWGNALGVNCTHCHNTHDWASEEKEDKQMAREMVNMTTKINGDLLKKIEGLEKASVNCSTCHRGEKKPGRSGNRPGGSGGAGGPPSPKKD